MWRGRSQQPSRADSEWAGCAGARHYRASAAAATGALLRVDGASGKNGVLLEINMKGHCSPD